MLRCVNKVRWLAISLVLGVAGCSGETAPPLAAISAPRDEEPKDNDSRRGAPAAPAFVQPKAESGQRPSTIPDTADGAVRSVVLGLQEGRLDAVWDALPASYQRDLNDLVHLAAKRLNPAAWRWSQQIAGKWAKLFRISLKEDVAALGESVRDDESAARQIKSYESLIALLERLSKSDPDLLGQLQTVDIGEFLRAEGATLIPDLSSLATLMDVDLGHNFEKALKVAIAVKTSTADSAVVGIRRDGLAHESESDDVEFVRLEGKWIPRLLAEHWTGAIVQADDTICKAFPSENGRDNFGCLFHLIYIADSLADMSRLEAKDPSIVPDDFDFDFYQTVIGAFSSLNEWMGESSKSKSDFQSKTRQSLSGRKKTTVVYCTASNELKLDHDAIDFELAKTVAYQLSINKINVVDPDRVSAWLAQNTEWKKTAEIGAAFDADFVVHIDVKDFGLQNENKSDLFQGRAEAHLFRGRAECIINVVKMDENKKDGQVIYTKPANSIFPIRGTVDPKTMFPSEFKERFLSFLSGEIGQLFYTAETEKDSGKTPAKE